MKLSIFHSIVDISKKYAQKHAANKHHKKQSNAVKRIKNTLSTAMMAGILLAIADGFDGRTDKSIAQISSYDSETGMVQLDRNALDIRTGALGNTSNIPLPTGLIQSTLEDSPQSVRRDKLAPNSVIITPDVPYIFQNIEAYLDNIKPADYTFEEESLSLTTQFNLQEREGAHAYGEGIELRVSDESGTEVSRESAFVRGYEVTVGPDGEELSSTNEISVDYGAETSVELRVLNIRQDGGEIQESGIYFSEDGDFVVEDLKNGGDRDFNDGKYLEIADGSGEANAIREEQTTTTETDVTETDLAPEIREEEIIETDVIENISQEPDQTSEEITDWGQVSTPTNASPRLAHASGALTEDDELLVYNRYSDEGHFRAGSDGLRLAGQLAPLLKNPKLPPTLLSGSVAFNPFAADNEAGLTGTIGLTQFLNPTHRQATDIFGNEIITPEGEDDNFLIPTGLFNNRKWVGYVPANETDNAGETLSDLLEPPSAEQWGYNRTTIASGFYLGGSLTGGLGNQKNTVTRIDSMLEVATDEFRTQRILNTYLTPMQQVDTVVTETISSTREAGKVLFDLNSLGEIGNARFLGDGNAATEIISQESSRNSIIRAGQEQLISSVTQQESVSPDSSVTGQSHEISTREESNANFSPLVGELTLGYVLNFGNTPWTSASNTLRAELFARDTVLGRRTNGNNAGWRAEMIFHPFGEVTRDAYQYDMDGTLQPVYQTEAVLDESGEQILERLVGPDNAVVEVPVNRFRLDENGDRIAQRVGTGQAEGPGLYLRMEDMFGQDSSPTFSAGLQFSF